MKIVKIGYKINCICSRAHNDGMQLSCKCKHRAAIYNKARNAVKRDEKRECRAFAKARRGGWSDELKPPYGGRIMQLQDGSTRAMEGEKVYTFS